MRLSKPLAAALFAVGLGGCVGGCAGPAPQPAAPLPIAAPVPPIPAPEVASSSILVADAIPAAQSAAVVDALQADLLRRLKPGATAGAVTVSRRPDGAPRVVLDSARAFETGSAQMRAETLLRIAECASAVSGTGTFVVHVIGYGERAVAVDGESLAERRATTVASYLLAHGLYPSRVRAEGRVGRDRSNVAVGQLELAFEPIVIGREVRAWLPPPAVAAR